jgi:Uma2 family endonuclease
MTPDEYLAFERASAEKHEYFDGEVFAMAGASEAHNLIVANLIRILGSALRDRPCRVYPSDLKMKLGRSFAYPDLSVVCGRSAFDDDQRDVLVNPKLIIEVLSDSTERFDRSQKSRKYRALESMSDYVLVSSSEPLVEQYHGEADGAWLMREYKAGGRVVLASIDVTFPVDEAYEKVWEATAG